LLCADAGFVLAAPTAAFPRLEMPAAEPEPA
jgi:hypothetical protein